MGWIWLGVLCSPPTPPFLVSSPAKRCSMGGGGGGICFGFGRPALCVLLPSLPANFPSPSSLARAAIMQLHPGWVGTLQKRYLSALGCLWFNRTQVGGRGGSAASF